MGERDRTSARTLLEAAETGMEEGLHFVYAGNLPGAVQSWESTYCPGCRACLVERVGFRVVQNRIGADGRCPDCARPIPGVWS
jgi:pyruvate formate lyase activating enzyme